MPDRLTPPSSPKDIGISDLPLQSGVMSPAWEVAERMDMAGELAGTYEGSSATALEALATADFSAVFPAAETATSDFTILEASPDAPSSYIRPVDDASTDAIYEVIMQLVSMLQDVDYVSNVEIALRAKLYTDITAGGTGLAEDVEAAIFDRASDRLEYELDKNYTAELSNFEAWGMELPDGVLAASLREVSAEGTRRRAELNRDVLIKQAELAQNNTQFSVTSGLAFEKQRMDFVIGVNDALARLLGEAVNSVRANSAHRTTQAQIDVQAYAARVEAFKGEVALAGAYMSAQAEALKAAGAQASANAELVTKQADSNLRVAAMLTELRTEALKSVANITAQKVASALSVLNVSASISAQHQLSNSVSLSNSYSFQESNSDSTSESDQTILSGDL